MKVKTAELTGVALDWAVAKCLGTLGAKPKTCEGCKHHEERAGRDEAIYYCHHLNSVHETEFGWADAISPAYGVHPSCPITELTPEAYSTDQAQGAPILDRELITTRFDQRRQGSWEAYHWTSSNHALTEADEQEFLMHGPTRLVAGLRCFVASRLGCAVEIPEELA